jgi:hypothetical protein
VIKDPELELLTGLCRELAALGLNVRLSDAVPAVIVQTSPGRSLVITVAASREFFQWCDAEERHPVADPTGAATRVAEFLRTSDTGPGEER